MIEIAGRRIGAGQAAFMVAEVGINHDGGLDTALGMIDVAKDCGADAVKFQTFKASEFCTPGVPFTYRSQGREVTEDMLDMFRRYEFGGEQWRRLKDHADARGILFLSTPQNESDMEILRGLGVPAIKVGSDDFTNLPLLRRYAKTGLPLILSCGMADLDEVRQSLDAAGWMSGHPIVVLVCTSQYPTPPEDVNIERVRTLPRTFPGLTVGFSDHTQGATAAVMAAAMGACVFEKHFTLDHDRPGPDHWFSADPGELREWIAQVRLAERMRGDGVVAPTAAEQPMRVLARRSVVALAPVAAGETFSERNLGLRRPGSGLPPAMFERVLGRRAARAIAAGVLLEHADVQW